MTEQLRGSTTEQGPSSLSQDQTETLRRRLEAERAAVLERTAVFVDENGQIDPTSATSGQGETEHTAVEIERRVNDALEAQAREGLAEVEAALARIEAGTYGRCELCGEAIAGERLVAMPATRFCVTCQAEQGRRR